VALINLSISFESCQRFGPTCEERNSASTRPILPFLDRVSSIIQFVNCAGEGSGNSSTCAIFDNFLNNTFRLSGTFDSVKTRTQNSGASSRISATILCFSAFSLLSLPELLRRSFTIIRRFSARKGSD